MSKAQWSRRDLLKSGVSASLGAITHPNPSTRTLHSPAVPSGLADEYHKYDGLGLAELIAKKQVTPLDLLTAVRQRVEL